MSSGIALISLLFIGQATTTSTTADYWRSPLQCGPNCLYAYLKLHGKDCTFEQISTRVAIEPRGANLSDLRRAATELGVPSFVLKTDEAGLPRISLPAIVHFRERGGHYQLLLALAPDSITTADMTSGELNEMPREKFLESWSGYVLTTADNSNHSILFWCSGCLLALPLLIVFKRRRHPAPLASADQ